jgi:hypothetical protein
MINATRPTGVLQATIADLPARLAAADIGGPVVVMIGRVFDRAAAAGPRGGRPPLNNSTGGEAVDSTRLHGELPAIRGENTAPPIIHPSCG